jgi:hypothetical protein
MKEGLDFAIDLHEILVYCFIGNFLCIDASDHLKLIFGEVIDFFFFVPGAVEYDPGEL